MYKMGSITFRMTSNYIRKNILLILLFVCQSYLVSGQAEMHINGKVINAANNEPVPFANIRWNREGTFTNTDGEFSFSITNNLLESSDTLFISSIGFQTRKVLLDTVKSNNSYLIVLKEDFYKLDEVVVNGKKEKLDVVEVVQNAIEKIKSNSNNSSYGVEAFYRQTHYFTNAVSGQINYLRYLEAAVLFQNTGDKYKSYVKEVRRSNDFRTTSQNLYKGDEEDERFNFEDYFLNLDCIKSLGEVNEKFTSAYSLLDPIVSNLNYDFVHRHSFKLDSIARFEGELVYVIKILPSKNSTLVEVGGSRNVLIPIGRLLITAHDYSIIEFQYSYIINPRKGTNINLKLLKVICQGDILFNDVVRYKKVDGKMYLSYIMRDQGDTLFMGGYKSSGLMRRKVNARDETDNGYFRVKRELVVNNYIDTNRLTKDYLQSNYNSIFPKTYVYNKEFWSQYNLVTSSKDEQKLLKDLGNGVPIEEQFKHNGSQ